MGIQFRTSAVALGVVAAAAASANIYSNRSTDTRIPALNPVAISQSGVAAPAGGFWSEVQNDLGNATESNTSAGASCRTQGTTTGEFRLADDFTVSNGKMVITAVRGYAYRSGTTSSTSLLLSGNANILSAAPNASPTTLASGSTFSTSYAVPVQAAGATVTTGNVFRCFNTIAPAPGTVPGQTRHVQQGTISLASPLEVGPGTYWVDYQLNQEAAPLAPFAFAPNTTHAGTRTPVGGVGNALQLISTGWTDSVDTGNPATAPDIIQEFPFVLVGHVVRFTEDFNITEGTYFGGVNADLQNSDDVYVFNLLDENGPNGQIRFSFKTTISFSSSFVFRVESGSDRGDQSYFIDIANATGGGWTQLAFGTTSIADSTVDVTVNNAQTFVSTGDNVGFRIRTVPQADLEVSDGWANRYDLVNLRCNP